jgi:pimeloyl-ACP methyl ester carboxylesterase
LHVERYGYGDEPVVLVHGFGTSSFLWRHIGPLLAVQGLRVFAIDLLGYGESDRPFEADFGVDAQSAYLDSALTALELHRATIVGLDLGALVGLRLAVDRPDRVWRLVMVGPPPLNDIGGTEIRELQRDTARYAFRLTQGLFGSLALLRPFLRDSVESPAAMPWRLLGRYAVPFLGREGTNHLLALAGSLREQDVADVDLNRVRQRVLITRGTRDRWCTRPVAEAYASAMPNGVYSPVDSVGHLVPEEDPSALAQLILAFVRTPDGGVAD